MGILLSALAVLFLMAKTSAVVALADPGDLEKFHGVWIGSSETADQQWHAGIVAPRHIDLAIRKTSSGFTITWNPLSGDGAERFEARLVAAGERGAFTATGVDPPLRAEEALWAQIVGDRLLLYQSKLGDDGIAYLARYALSVSNGRMTFGYTLRRGNEVLESVEGRLSRAKVVF